MTDAPVVVTHSELNMFLSCRRKWAWYFVHDRQKPERHHGPLALGSRVHAAIEEYYKDGSDPIAAHERLAAEAVARAEADGERFIDTLYEDIIVGRNCVIAHQQWLEDTGADSNYDVEMVEEKLEAPILGGRVLLRGKVDVMFRERDSGALFISDLKTSGNWWGGQRELLERSYQHHVYLALTQLVHPETEFIGGALYTYWPIDYSKPVDKAGDRARGIEGIRGIADFANDLGINLCLEVLNRFENHVLNTAAEGVSFVQEVDKPNVKVMLDTFHMNIEEDSMGGAIRSAGALLGHFHTGECNRKVPGRGRMPWREIGEALRDINYAGAVVMEPFVKMGGTIGSDIKVWRDLSQGADAAQMDQDAKDALIFSRYMLG